MTESVMRSCARIMSAGISTGTGSVAKETVDGEKDLYRENKTFWQWLLWVCTVWLGDGVVEDVGRVGGKAVEYSSCEE